MKTEVVVVPNYGRDLSWVPLAALKDPAIFMDLPAWFDPSRFTLVDSAVSRERLGFGTFTFTTSYSSVVGFGSSPMPQLPAGAAAAAEAPPTSSGGTSGILM